jgi:predicted ATPase
MKQPVEPQLHNFPLPSTPFVGRSEEIEEITRLLSDSDCQLLTLVGPGGIGKTRLAIQAALKLSGKFFGGIYFVSLQPVQSADLLATTIADSLHLGLSGPEDPAIQLSNFLRDKDVLLVLDNFEQLLTPAVGGQKGGEDLLIYLLQAAPGVKFLVTSREVLNLQEEWLYQVYGLPRPTDLQPVSIESYGAVQLFADRAHRVRRDFSLQKEQSDVIQICQLVEGMPLALELAASWTKSLSCSVIVAEIRRNMDFLATRFRNVPERQRSMRAVFDQSWKLLTPTERDVFKRLSVFQGGFQREAAKQVARASLATLSALVDKSLLRAESDSRYQIHELLRQYAAEQLVLSPEAVAQVYDSHCVYYAAYVNSLHEDVKHGKQQEATGKIAAERQNVRAAWQWAVQQAKVDEIHQAADTLFYFFQFQSRYQEGLTTFTAAAESLERAEPVGLQGITLAEILIYQGWFCLRLGRLKRAKVVLEESLSILEELDTLPAPGVTSDPLTALGTLANILGDYIEAERLGEESRRRNEESGDKGNLMDSFYVLTNAVLAQGRYEDAQRYAQRAYALAQDINDRWMMAYILSDLGNVARALGDYAQAKHYYQASYTIKNEFDDPEGMAVVLNHLGKIAILQEDYPNAKRLYQAGLSIYREINDRGGLATSLNGLGMAACALEDFYAASNFYEEALQVTVDMQFVPLTLSILVGVCELMRSVGQPERGVELLSMVLDHPAADGETKVRARRCLSRYQTELAPEAFAEATRRGNSDDLEAIIAAVVRDLSTLGEAPQAEDKSTTKLLSEPGTVSVSTTQPADLVEPLTPRELEVLQLMAEGLTNQQMAEELVISVGTVKWYTGQIYGKLGVSNRTQAVVRGREINLLP